MSQLGFWRLWSNRDATLNRLPLLPTGARISYPSMIVKISPRDGKKTEGGGKQHNRRKTEREITGKAGVSGNEFREQTSEVLKTPKVSASTTFSLVLAGPKSKISDNFLSLYAGKQSFLCHSD